MNIKVHAPYLGQTGYAAHARGFVRALSKRFPAVLVRNFTDDPKCLEYLDDLDYRLLSERTLRTPNGSLETFPMAWNDKILDINAKKEKIHIVLQEVGHHYFYDNYNGPKIAYTVWETTEYPITFFDKLLKFDWLWVPTEWHKIHAIQQGYPEQKIKIVREGLDWDCFTPINIQIQKDRPFRFLIFGRWEYRKSTIDMIQCFVNEFAINERVELILCADNPFASDGIISAAEKLKKLGISDSRIKTVAFLPRQQYTETLLEGDVFLSCSRGEGWNRPLHEAMALGVPSIFSNYGPQLEFASGFPLGVSVLDERPANQSEETRNTPGQWCEPNFEHLRQVMRMAYEEFPRFKNDAEKRKHLVTRKFSWDAVAADAVITLNKDIIKHTPKFIFMTCVDERFIPITDALSDSIRKFSKSELIVYGLNFMPNQTLGHHQRKLDYKIDINSDIWYAKQQTCIQAIQDFPDSEYFVWIDGDAIVNSNIDNIQLKFDNILGYPLIDGHALEMYTTSFFNESGCHIRTTFFNEDLIQEFGIERRNKKLGHACMLVFDRTCGWFFQEVIDTYLRLKTQGKQALAVWNDEGIDNLLRWKYGIDGIMPQSNFETGFNPERFESFFESGVPNDFGDPSGWNHIPKDKRQIIYFHGQKDPIKARTILNTIIKQFAHSDTKFWLPSGIISDLSDYSHNISTLDVGNRFGWEKAIWHEINILRDYCQISEMSISAGSTVMDIGANIGIFSRFARKCGANRILSFEPDRRYFWALSMNAHPDDELFECAVSATNGEMEFFLSNHFGGSSIVPSEYGHKEMVSCTTLEYIINALQLDKIDFLKVDAEGAEHDIFSNISDRTLQKIDKISMEYHNMFWDCDTKLRDQLIRRFTSAGFKVYILFLGQNDHLQMIYLWQS